MSTRPSAMSAALNAYSPQDPMIGNDGLLPLPTSRHAPHYLPIPFGASDTFWHVPILFGARRTIWRLSPRARTRQHEYPKFGCPTPLPAGTAQQTRRKQILSDLAFRSDFGHTKGRPLCIKMSVPSVEVGGIEPPSDREYLLLLRVQSVLDSRPHAAHRPGHVGLKLPRISNQPK